MTETGNSLGVLHQYLAQGNLGYSEEEIQGKTIFVIKSATKLTTKGFSDYLTQIDAFTLDEGDIFPYYDSMRINVRAFLWNYKLVFIRTNYGVMPCYKKIKR